MYKYLSHISVVATLRCPHHLVGYLQVVLLSEMLIEDVKIVFFKIIQKLFCFDGHQESSVCVLWKLFLVFSSNLKMFLGIG